MCSCYYMLSYIFVRKLHSDTFRYLSINEPDAVHVQVQDVQAAPSPPQLTFNCLTQAQASTPKGGIKSKVMKG